jgi:phosphoribosyl 1,2-cyclic phosphodiesterase
MKFQQHYSSSRGNLYTVTAHNDKRLLFECGVTWKRLQRALDYDLSNIVGCFVSHEHKDHCKAIKEIMRAGIDVYASAGTFEALNISDERRAKVIKRHKVLNLKEAGIGIMPILLNHDAAAPFGFVIHESPTQDYILFIPDTSHIKQRFKIPFSIIAIEGSYDRDILQKRVDNNDINEEVAKRLLNSHMEKRTAMNYLSEYCDLSKCREIHLLHMSGENLDKRRTKKEFEKRFFIETIIV